MMPSLASPLSLNYGLRMADSGSTLEQSLLPRTFSFLHVYFGTADILYS